MVINKPKPFKLHQTSAEKWFQDLLSKLTITDSMRGENHILFNLNGICYMAYDKSEKLLAYDYDVYKFLNNNFHLQDIQIISLIKRMMKETYNIDIHQVV